MDSDILRPMADDELLILANNSKKFWPSTIRAHHFLRQQHQWLQKFKNLDKKQLDQVSGKCFYKFYTPADSDPDECAFVAISGAQDYCVFYHTLEDPPTKLAASIRRTKRIDFSLEIVFTSIEERHQSFMFEHLKDLGVDLKFNIASYIYRLERRVAESFTVTIPENLSLANLTVKDVPTIVEVWPHRYPGCEVYIESVLRLNYGLGLYDTSNGNQLLAWAMRNENGAVGFIQTAEAAKRKGLATLILKVLSKRLAEENNDDVLAFVVQVNEPSNRLFQKNGFEIVGRCAWFGTEAKTL